MGTRRVNKVRFRKYQGEEYVILNLKNNEWEVVKVVQGVPAHSYRVCRGICICVGYLYHGHCKHGEMTKARLVFRESTDEDARCRLERVQRIFGWWDHKEPFVHCTNCPYETRRLDGELGTSQLRYCQKIIAERLLEKSYGWVVDLGEGRIGKVIRIDGAEIEIEYKPGKGLPKVKLVGNLKAMDLSAKLDGWDEEQKMKYRRGSKKDSRSGPAYPEFPRSWKPVRADIYSYKVRKGEDF